jgi:hypothetical protein
MADYPIQDFSSLTGWTNGPGGFGNGSVANGYFERGNAAEDDAALFNSPCVASGQYAVAKILTRGEDGFGLLLRFSSLLNPSGYLAFFVGTTNQCQIFKVSNEGTQFNSCGTITTSHASGDIVKVVATTTGPTTTTFEAFKDTGGGFVSCGTTTDPSSTGGYLTGQYTGVHVFDSAPSYHNSCDDFYCGPSTGGTSALSASFSIEESPIRRINFTNVAETTIDYSLIFSSGGDRKSVV